MTYKIGVLGLRSVGMGHVRAWSKTPGAKVVAVADLEEERRARAAAEVDGVRLYSDYRALLDDGDLDIVSICLPTGMHERVLQACVEAGVHVLCEKPPASNAEEARRMADLAAEAGVTLGYSLQQRFRPEVQAARQAVENGQVGDLYYGRIGYVRTEPWLVPQAGWRSAWRFDAEKGGGSLLDLGVHILDLTWYIMGCPKPTSVTGFTSTRMVGMMTDGINPGDIATPADDTTAALIRFEGDRAILLESSFGIYRTQPSSTYCDLTGTKGGLSVPMKAAPELVQGTGERTELDLPQGPEGRDAMTRDFLSAVKDGRDPIVSAEQGVLLMSVLDAIFASGASGQSISL